MWMVTESATVWKLSLLEVGKDGQEAINPAALQLDEGKARQLLEGNSIQSPLYWLSHLA